MLHIQNTLLKPHQPDARTPAASEPLNLFTLTNIIIFVSPAIVEDIKFNFHAQVPKGKQLIIIAAIVVNSG